MKGIDSMKDWIGALTELGADAAGVGDRAARCWSVSNLPFFGNVTANIMALRQRPRQSKAWSG